MGLRGWSYTNTSNIFKMEASGCLEFCKNAKISILDENICTKFGRKVHHGYAKIWEQEVNSVTSRVTGLPLVLKFLEKF